MKCFSCGIEIPAQFKSVIAKNICPGCEQPILTDKAKELLEELKEVFTKMPNDIEGICVWLLSTFQMTKLGEIQPINQFHGANNLQFNNPAPQMQGTPNPTQSQANANAFLQRALPGFIPNVPETHQVKQNLPADDPHNLKAVANQILSNQLSYQYGDGESNSLTPEEESPDPDPNPEVRAPTGNTIYMPFGSGGGVGAKAEQLNTPEAQALKALAISRTVADGVSEPALQSQLKRLAAQNKIKSGTPGNKKNTFWRST
jgi:hypothetical protein